MIDAAEALGGPYRWGRYDVLVLPPSFPFGGMENPRVTFATPTILAGDRSLTSLIAHELAHSWSGNLVTNATWRDFWLNEGFTTYFENRIMEQLYGERRARMLEVLGRRELASELASLKDKPGDQILHIDLAGRNPDDGVTPIAYDKGAAFVRMIEAAVGRPRFDAWLRGYFDRHAFTSLTTAEFLEDLRAHLSRAMRGSSGRCSSTRGSSNRACPTTRPRRHPTHSASSKARWRASRRRAAAQPRDDGLDHTAVAALSRVAACRDCRRRSWRIWIARLASARAATARCCLPGSGSPSGIATSPPCRPSSASSRLREGGSSSSRWTRT